MSSQKGFTIIELLISTALMAIVITGLILIFIQQQRTFNFTSESIDIDQTGRTALDFLASEIRNAGARQGKTMGIRFFNGGSGEDPRCSDNTSDDGTTDSPPDCIKIFTWDITRGQSGSTFPSIPLNIAAILDGGDLDIGAASWLPPLQDPALIESGDLVGFWSRGALCNPIDTTNCNTDPERCTECGVILTVGNISGTNLVFDDDLSSIIDHNINDSSFLNFDDFVDNALQPLFINGPSEMTIVESKTFAIDTDDRELLMELDESNRFDPIAGGVDTAGIVDLQLVFNLQDSDGGVTKVGLALDDANRHYPDFNVVGSAPVGNLNGREKDIRAIEIYLVVSSRLKPQLLSGQRIPSRDFSSIGDVPLRQTSHSSLGEGFMYKVFSTVVYMRNFAREEFG